jgi:hypothetical protein
VVGIGGSSHASHRHERAKRSSTKVVSSGGFDWGDAAIGGALALGLALLAGTAVRVSRQVGKPQTA